jgi:hypothetical protein
VEQSRELLLGMGEEQEILAQLEDWEASINKHGTQEYSA